MCHSGLEACSYGVPVQASRRIVQDTAGHWQLQSVHDASHTLWLSRRLTALESESSYADSGVLCLLSYAE
jgi:hypothetical protein